jgi:4-oxalocrotonate tautomerase
MPFLTVTTWPNMSDNKSRKLIEELTKTVHKVTGAPLKKITVVINEIPQNRWGGRGNYGI